jgi:hypothetical protein
LLGRDEGAAQPFHISIEEGYRYGRPVQVREVRPYVVEARQLLRRADEEGQLVPHGEKK